MSDLLIELEPPLAWVRINRPDKRNALSSASWLALPQIAAQLQADPRIRVVLLTGVGDEAFCAGADIGEMRANLANPDAMRVMQQATQDGQRAWAALPMPTIAMIRGACTGGGCGLALCCDIRLGTPDSYYAIPPAKLGLAYSLDDTKRLVDVVGVSRAKEMLFSGRRVDAAEAAHWGLLNQVVDAANLLVDARALALSIADSAQNSVRIAKRIVGMISNGVLAETAESAALFNDSFSSAEFREGAAAFAEKRKPRF